MHHFQIFHSLSFEKRAVFLCIYFILLRNTKILATKTRYSSQRLLKPQRRLLPDSIFISIISHSKLLFFNRILNSEIISSTILFNNGSKFENLSEPVVMNLSSVTEVRFILNLSSFLILKLARYNIVSYGNVFYCPFNQSVNQSINPSIGLLCIFSTMNQSVICLG